MQPQPRVDERQEETLEKSIMDRFSFQYETFSDFERGLELIFSPAAASVILYTAAIKCGAHAWFKILFMMIA